MGKIGQWVWVWLGLVEVLHACQIPPALISSHLKETIILMLYYLKIVKDKKNHTLMRPAPSMILTISHRYPQMIRLGGGRLLGSLERLKRGTAQIARNPEGVKM